MKNSTATATKSKGKTLLEFDAREVFPPLDRERASELISRIIETSPDNNDTARALIELIGRLAHDDDSSHRSLVAAELMYQTWCNSSACTDIYLEFYSSDWESRARAAA